MLAYLVASLLGLSGLLGGCLESTPACDGASRQDASDDSSTVLRQGGEPLEAGDSIVDSSSVEVHQRGGLLQASSRDDVVSWLSIGPRDSPECRARIFKIPPSHPEYKNMRAGDSVRLTAQDVDHYYCFRAQDRAGSFAFMAQQVEDYAPPPPRVDRETTSGFDPQPDIDVRQFSGHQFKVLLESVTLPNLVALPKRPEITGNTQTDARLWRIAEEQGYRLQPVVASLDELETVEQRLLQPEAARAYLSLREAARQAGHQIKLYSGYRGFDVQRYLLLRRLEPPYTDAKIAVELRIVAPPGYSRHQTGYALDLAAAEYGINEFEYSNAYAWLAADNFLQAKKHGFIPSYPDGVENQGPDPEPWEFVYVGTDNLVASR